MTGQELERKRESYRLAKSDLALIAGVTTRSIYNWEASGKLSKKVEAVLTAAFEKIDRGEIQILVRDKQNGKGQEQVISGLDGVSVNNASCNISQQTVANKVETPKVSDKMAEDLETLTEQINALAKQVETYRAIIDVKDEQISKLIDLLSKR